MTIINRIFWLTSPTIRETFSRTKALEMVSDLADEYLTRVKTKELDKLLLSIALEMRSERNERISNKETS